LRVRLTRNIERRFGRLVETISGRKDDAEIDLAALVLDAVTGAVVDGPAGPIAPNRITVSVVGEPADQDVVTSVAEELSALVDAAAGEHGWRLEGSVDVAFRFCEDGSPGVDTLVSPGPLPAWAELSRVAGSHVATIHHGRAIVGRSSSAAVVLDSDTISRRHALVIRQSGSVWLADLGSANGTYLNGSPVGDPVEILAGDVLGFGDASYAFRPLEVA
jgi:hypothetical protein